LYHRERVVVAVDAEPQLILRTVLFGENSVAVAKNGNGGDVLLSSLVESSLVVAADLYDAGGVPAPVTGPVVHEKRIAIEKRSVF
jgi:hypothetical protein